MIIKNFQKLAKTPLRRLGLKIIEAGLNESKTKKILKKSVKRRDRVLVVENKEFLLSAYKHIYFVGIGKGALDGAEAIEKILGKYLTYGIALDIRKKKLRRIKSFAGTHPFPSEKNLKITEKVVKLLKAAREDDLIIALISGGGSALFSSNYELPPKKEVRLTKLLFKKGATIREINILRKHISDVKAGNFAKLAYPATVVSLIFSDVPTANNDLAVIASGPTVYDKTTKKDAEKIIRKYLRKSAYQSALIRDLAETPKEIKYFKKVFNFVLLTNKKAIQVMEKTAQKYGFKTKIVSKSLSGEASKVGEKLAKLSKPGWMVLAGGETTVTIKRAGKGGRNQEVVLGAISKLPKASLIISLNSDGLDNTPAAGALADNLLIKKAQNLQLDPEKYLKNNDSYNFFKRVNGHIITGPTGINISDLMLVLQPTTSEVGLQ